VLINEGHSLDVIEIDAASNRGVDEIRELRERVKYRPAQSRFKVYIIDEAHMLTREAFNALLKTLEEPPEYVVFILATTDPQKIPPTVLSRCQRFRFKKLTSDEVYQILVNVCKKEGFSYEEDALQLIAEISDGAVRDALNLLEQISVVDEGKVTIKTARFLTNLVEDDVVVGLLGKAQESMDEAVEQIANLLESGVEPMELFRTMKTLVRRSVFKGEPWPRETALDMFKVLESYNFVMDRTEFPSVAVVAIVDELRKVLAGRNENVTEAPKVQHKRQQPKPSEKQAKPVETQEEVVGQQTTEPDKGLTLGPQELSEHTEIREDKGSNLYTEANAGLEWIEHVRKDYLPLYVVLKEGKARLEGDKIVLSFPGLKHVYRRFMDLPRVQSVLRKYGNFKVDIETGDLEEKDIGVLDLFKQVFPDAKIEEVK
jgi:DNA polymerase-3 subunit gamma/tau